MTISDYCSSICLVTTIAIVILRFPKTQKEVASMEKLFDPQDESDGTDVGERPFYQDE